MRNSQARSFIMLVALAAGTHVIVRGQGSVSQNINVITGSSDQFVGDVFRQRQNEAVLGISSVNPAHMMAAYNDYRTVDFVDPSPICRPSPQQGDLREASRSLSSAIPGRARPVVKGKGQLPMMAAAHAWIGLSFSDDGGNTGTPAFTRATCHIRAFRAPSHGTSPTTCVTSITSPPPAIRCWR